jgi:hypothetical protein
MKSEQIEFPRLKSVRVVVEERKVALQMTPDTWRSYEFSGIETVPERLRPAFLDGEEGMACELELLELVRKSYRSGRTENRYELPYHVANGAKSPTVLRSVVVTCQYRKQANAAALARPRAAGVAMPMAAHGLWSRVETDRVEAELRQAFPRLSETVVALVVRLVKLDLRPREGVRRLRAMAEAMLERRGRWAA